MIFSIMRTSFTILARDRAALLLTFVLPIAFFSIFAGIFGSQKRAATKTIRIAVVDEDRSEASTRLIEALRSEPGLKVQTGSEPEQDKTETTFDAHSAEAAVRNGDVPVALIIPKGFGAAPIAFGRTNGPKLKLLNDSSDPIAPQMVFGLLQKSVATSMPDVMADQGSKYFEQYSGGLTAAQKKNIDEQLRALRAEVRNQPGRTGAAGNSSGLLDVSMQDVMGERKANPIVAFYAAGIGVMFLLFSASRSGGTLLDEADSGALDRVLSTRVNMSTLLLGKLGFLALLGFLELTVMFVWGALVFKLDLMSHLPGFFLMTGITAIAASAFGLVLAAACRTRAQLAAVSTLVILIMSALGGSMFPRFLMPEGMQRFGLITFNAWALDGFIKVFWREAPLLQLWPQVLVLATASLVFYLAARRLAKKWEFS